MTANIPLVHHFAIRYRGRGVEYSDLAQAGMIGLVCSVRKYDPNKGAFSTYASFWIKKYIFQEISREIRGLRLKNEERGELCRKDLRPLEKEEPTQEEKREQWENEVRLYFAVKGIKEQFRRKHRAQKNITIHSVVHRMAENPALYSMEIQKLRRILNGTTAAD